MLFQYLRDIIYDPAHASLELSELEEDCRALGQGLMFLDKCLQEQRAYAAALAQGDLGVAAPSPENELAAPLKSLQANLKHLTWQSQQVAKGDYMQHVDFMGEFAEAFNTMTRQLAARQRALEAEIENGRQKTKALEQSNSLLTDITYQIPQKIVVVNCDDDSILYRNFSAKVIMEANENFFERLMEAAGTCDGRSDEGAVLEFSLEAEGQTHYYVVHSYPLNWNGVTAKAFVVNDISADRALVKRLEVYAYQDTLTKLHNRFSGMRVLEKWLGEKRHFTVCFADLDNLKFVNDTYGHSEGDQFIIGAARQMEEFSPDTVACRLGGDEFMLLVPEYTAAGALARMKEISLNMQEMNLRDQKPYCFSISCGVVEVGPDNHYSASTILSLADERMYEDKRRKKKRVIHKKK